MSASFLSPFFLAISKISEDQVAEIENEKETMKDRRGKKKKEEGGRKSLKRISPECRRWVFSVLIGKVPSRLSPQPPWLRSGTTSLFPFVCSPSDSKHRMEMTHIDLTADLDHNHSSLSLIGDQNKTSFCE